MPAPENHSDDIAVVYAQALGMSVENVHLALRQVAEGCTEDGLLAVSAAAHTMLRMAKQEMQIADCLTWERDARGNMNIGRYDPTFFDVESKEGQQRRREAREARKEARACLREARQHFAQAAAFRIVLGDGRPLKTEARVEDAAEEDEETRAVREFRQRVIETANQAEQRTREKVEADRSHRGSTIRKKVKKEGREGLRRVAEAEEKLAATESA